MKMKNGLKKLFAVCLALSMVLGISVPTVANAETASNVIDVVEVNGVQEAVIGEVATEATMTVPEGANYTIDQWNSGWYDWTAEEGEESWLKDREGETVFEDDHKYEIKVMVRPADGYVFTEDTVLKINGEEIPADDYFVNVYEQRQYLSWDKEYSFLEQIDKIEINNVPTAEIDKEATTQGITRPEDANYEIGDTSWYNYTTDEYLAEGDIFEKGNVYNLDITVNAADGYEFTEDTVVVVDGETLTYDEYYAYGENAYIWKEYSFTEKINKVEINNVPTAEVGKEATSDGVTVPEGANYEIDYDYTGWDNETTGEEVTIFEDGNRYSFCISLVAKDGYEFAEDAVVLVNGKEEYEEAYLYGQWGEIYCEYSFLEQIDKIEISEELPDAKAGETAGADELGPVDAKYSASYAWMTGNMEVGLEPFTGTFEAGKAYMLAVTIEPAEGYEFAEDVAVTIAGKAVDTVFVTNTGDYYVIMETHDLGENTIDKIEITATEPKAGEKISVDNVKVPEDAKYEILYAAWCNPKTGNELTGTFEEGKQYQLMVVVATDEGVYLANDTKITLNGKEFAGAKFDNNMVAMPFLAVCELGFDLTVTDNNQNNNQNNNNTNNNTQNNSNQNTTVKPSPATGDNTNMILWIVLAVIAMAGMAVVTKFKKER